MSPEIFRKSWSLCHLVPNHQVCIDLYRKLRHNITSGKHLIVVLVPLLKVYSYCIMIREVVGNI